MTDIEPFMEQA